MVQLKKIISGGQTGVDQAALCAAQKAGLECGGWCPPGRLCESGIIPAHFPLKETPAERSPDAPDVPRSQRTEWNVRDSDATLIFQPAHGVDQDPGTEWTARWASRYGRPLLVCDPSDPAAADRITQWLRSLPVETLNVAGPSERTAPGLGNQTCRLLKKVITDL